MTAEQGEHSDMVKHDQQCDDIIDLVQKLISDPAVRERLIKHINRVRFFLKREYKSHVMQVSSSSCEQGHAHIASMLVVSVHISFYLLLHVSCYF